MISFVKGELSEIDEDVIVVEAGGIGYNIHVPTSLLDTLPCLGSEVKIYTFLRISEDAVTLYGFASRQDLKIFKQLLGVNGVGPKGGLAILSVLNPADLRLAILSGDAKAIARAPGIGIKTAQRVILDMKDRIPMEDVLSPLSEEETAAAGHQTGLTASERDAIDALVALGYAPVEAARAVRKSDAGAEESPDRILRQALKYLSL